MQLTEAGQDGTSLTMKKSNIVCVCLIDVDIIIRTSEILDAKKLRRPIYRTSCPNLRSETALIEPPPLPHLSSPYWNQRFLELIQLRP